MQPARDANYSQYYFSARLQKKMKLLTASKATVLEAPSGYGKTTVIRGFLRDMAPENDVVFWFNAVDEEAPTMLYRRLCGEIGKIDSNAGWRLLEIDFPNAFTIGEVCDVLRSIKCSRKTRFVIDNFHFLFAILPASFLTALLDNGSEELCIVIITQSLGQDLQKTIAGLGILYISVPDLQWNAGDVRSYFGLAGESISAGAASEVERITSGWNIAVYLQLCSYRETGAFSDEAVSQLIEHLIWDKMRPEQRELFLRISVFESCTAERLCRVLECETIPDYAADSLSMPFIRYIAEQKICVPHKILRDMVRVKRRERGEKFDAECLLKAGDICRDEGGFVEAVYFYAQIKNYRRILSLDLSQLVCAEIGDRLFNDIALEIALNCSAELITDYPLSMLSVAWAVRFFKNEEVFTGLMGQLDSLLPQSGHLRAEWQLLSVYLRFPYLKDMLTAVQKAEKLFGGTRSSVILPEAPWAFYEYLQLSTFHIETGAADEEADLLEDFISIYSQLTGGHGTGADTLFRAELSFFRCDTAQAEIYAHRTVFISESRQQKVIQIGAVRLLAVIALLKADLTGWKRIVDEVEYTTFGSVQNTVLFRMMLDAVHGSLMAQLREYERIADWLKNPGFTSLQLPAAIYIKAVETYGYYLLGKGENAQLIGFLQSVPFDKNTPFPEHFRLLTIAAGYSASGNTEKAVECIDTAAKIALPDSMLHCFAGFSLLVNGLSDEVIKTCYPDFLILFKQYKKQYFTGWFSFYKAMAKSDLPDALTGREREIAELAAEGLRNIEIAERLFLSEHTVRAHLRSIYQKLDIDRRSKLIKIIN